MNPTNFASAYVTALSYALNRDIKTDRFVIIRTVKNIRERLFGIKEIDAVSVVKIKNLLEEFLEQDDIFQLTMSCTFGDETETKNLSTFTSNIDALKRLKQETDALLKK